MLKLKAAPKQTAKRSLSPNKSASRLAAARAVVADAKVVHRTAMPSLSLARM